MPLPFTVKEGALLVKGRTLLIVPLMSVVPGWTTIGTPAPLIGPESVRRIGCVLLVDHKISAALYPPELAATVIGAPKGVSPRAWHLDEDSPRSVGRLGEP